MTKCLLYYLLPWLYNMELVDPNFHLETPAESQGGADKSANSNGNVGSREGWGTAEATEMITNNLFYLTVKVGEKNEMAKLKKIRICDVMPFFSLATSTRMRSRSCGPPCAPAGPRT